jgi:hypothetical protein
MGKYKTFGSRFDRVHRNDLNANFAAVEADINAQKGRVDELIIGTPQPSEVVDSRGGFPVLGERLNDLSSSLAQMSTLETDNEQVQLGAELLDATGWTSTGWTGDFNAGFTHVVGQSTPLIKTVPITAGKMYQVQLRLTPTCQLDGGNGTPDFNVTIGGSEPFMTYQGAADTKLYSFGIVAPAAGDLVITPEPRYEGVITELSVKEMVGNLTASLNIKDTTGATAFEIRPTKSSLNNVYVGKNTGRYNTTGNQNAVIGQESFALNTSGYWNSGLGYMALNSNTVGSRNMAIGYNALGKNIGGHRNVAIGSFAVCRNTNGANNIGIGADSLWMNTTGNQNIGIGLAALGENITGSDNIGIGIGAVAGNDHGLGNIGIGRSALVYTKGNDSVAIGRWALFATLGSSNVAVGASSQRYNPGGAGNVSVGTSSLKNPVKGTLNVAVGENAGLGATNADITGNTLIGFAAGQALGVKGDFNTLIGCNAGNTITTGQRNILIGYNIQVDNPTDTSKLNIGGTIIGDLVSQNIGIGATPQTDADTAYSGGIKLQIGKSNKMGMLDFRTGTNANAGNIGGIGFINENNTNLNANTRKHVAYILVDSMTTTANANGDSGGRMRFVIKGDAAGQQEKMRLENKGIGIGGVSGDVSAKLHLHSGSSTAGSAPLKFTSGSLLGTKEAGAVEYDGTDLYFTDNAGVRYKLSKVAV